MSILPQSLVAASLLAVVTVSPLVSQEFRFVEIVGLADVTDINNRGVVVGEIGPGFDPRAATWTETGGAVQLAGVTEDSLVAGINEAGQVAGTFLAGGATEEAFLWENGVVTRLGVFPGTNRSTARGLTESGVVGVEAGNSGSGGSIVGASTLFFSDSGTQLQSFPVPGGADGINDLFQVVGQSSFMAGGSVPFILDASGVVFLDSPAGPAGAVSRGEGSAINNAGLVVGRTFGASGFSASNIQAVYWDGQGPGVVIPVLDSQALGVNEFGVIVGSGGDGNAFRTTVGGATQRLADLTNLPGGFELFEASAINELGQIIGRFERSPFNFGTCLLDPIELGDRFAIANPNSTGAPARIRAIGSASASSDSGFTLQVTSAPESPGVFALGLQANPVPFDAGVVALDALTVIPVPVDQANGVSSLRLSLPPSAGGLTVSFQYFFVDVPAGNVLNSSDGIEVSFLN